LFAAGVIFTGWDWLWVGLGGLVLGAAFLFWNYRAAPAGPARWVCPALKLLGLAALAFCLLEPLGSGQRAKPRANLIAIVADNSQGLRVRDPGAIGNRGAQLRQLLNPQQHRWQEALEENFETRRYFFDSRLQNTRDFSELAFDGRASAIGSALRTLAERYQGRPLAGVLLLTDGNATDLQAKAEFKGLPPVYPVAMGDSAAIQDISVQQVNVTQTDFEDAPVTVQATAQTAGYRKAAIVGELLDGSGKQIASQTLEPAKDSDQLAFRFQFRPEKSGLAFYRLRVREKGESAAPEKESREATLLNNHAVAVVDRGKGPYRILYVSGRPNWDFKFLNRAVQEDDQVQLVALIRVAKREPKFNFIGRAGETSNPLFRGFDNQSPEDIERYDQPVLVRLNTRDEFELQAGFPKTPEELYGYHAIILDHLEADFFKADQANLVQKFVSERGGGFLMLGGMESFQQGKYHRTPIGDMLPVYLDKTGEEAKPPGPLRMDFTREGLLQPWARLRDKESDEKARLQTMTPFQVLNKIKEIKPGASVIATVTDSASQIYPALVVQQFGRGRTAALPIGDVWRWGFRDAEAQQDMAKSWRQLLRWLVSNVPNRVEVAAEPQPGDPDGKVVLQTRVRDPRFQPLDNAAVTLEIQTVLADGPGAGETNLVRLQAEPAPNEPGLYQAAYTPRFTAGYKVTATVTNSEGASVGQAAAGWSSDLAAEEFRSLTPNLALLEDIARKTGGEVVRADKLDQLVRSLPQRKAPVMESWTYPLWHTPAMLGFALLCFAGEWGYRRWKGLP
jgi:uncharacterized membrane protein